MSNRGKSMMYAESGGNSAQLCTGIALGFQFGPCTEIFGTM